MIEWTPITGAPKHKGQPWDGSWVLLYLNMPYGKQFYEVARWTLNPNFQGTPPTENWRTWDGSGIADTLPIYWAPLNPPT
jgi:hypothetical protein